ncbi:hypothetical protein [Salsipaludibacter albus]|uniref:hypothetical protein n=1 Tax=Salsipaludibacter albus TaxID=2849650 RepID=UPI001EE41E01|nr:hypothetical protein [Salsipaludibacter albus]MBY5162869.1 hypothetical protein [Salsipaludibacter albus]
MRELLRALADWLAFFFQDAEYRLVDSEVGQSFGDAFVVWSNGSLDWRLVRDRSQLFLEARPMGVDEWFDIDLLMRVLGEPAQASSELTPEHGHWVRVNLATIHALFVPENVAGTAAELRAAKRQRAQELFG